MVSKYCILIFMAKEVRTERPSGFLRFEVKTAVDEEGSFQGRLSTYNTVDNVGDMVLPGAYTKTLQSCGSKAVLLWQHDQTRPIGTVDLEDKADGLWVNGRILIDDAVPDGKKAYVLMKNGIVDSLSIGYRPIRKEMKDGVRMLQEIKLYEASVVTIPADPNAQITAVKSMGDGTGDFDEEFAEAMASSAPWMVIQTLQSCLMQVAWAAAYDDDGDLKEDLPNITAYAGEVFDQAKAQFVAAITKLGGMVSGEEADKALHLKARSAAKAGFIKAMADKFEFKGKPVREEKSGRTISAATAKSLASAHEQIKSACATLSQAGEILTPLYEAGADEDVTPASTAGSKTVEPEIPLDLLSELKAMFA